MAVELDHSFSTAKPLDDSFAAITDLERVVPRRRGALRRRDRDPGGPDRPAFRGNGPDDYVCVQCGNILAEAMNPVQMTKKVRVKCGRCATVNVAVTDEADGGGR